ncbi:RND superfamily putative drug exporter [Mumia flava]|uniref:RND superfamily putative drug exporter n=1 Tax=Mumia flava TaxID=1348852 RepID=A0A0B2BPI8_9ACTN|nr:MMPL family transporter [Mumia flava]PJJ57163.1 RND superfamily putative drug exporter [Mumia flava]
MSSLLDRLGRATAAHPWRTITAWVVALAAALALAAAAGGTFQDDWDVPGAEAQRGLDTIREHLPSSGGASALVAVHDPDGDRLAAGDLTHLADQLGDVDHVVDVSPARVSDDGDTALLAVRYDVPVTHPDVMGALEPLEQAVDAAALDGVEVDFAGEVPSSAMEMSGRGELIGVGVALVLLILTFGSVVAAGLPIAVAVGGLALGTAGVTLLAATRDVSTTAPTVATMVGLGVGIDYALLLVTRFAERTSVGEPRVEAAGYANRTAGRSVVFAGITVLVSLMGLGLAGLPTYSAFGLATGITVVAVMAAALTLVPALCGLAGPRVLARRIRRGGPELVDPSRPSFTARWAARVGARPLPWALAALIVLLALAAPALGMRTFPQDASADPSSFTTRQAYDVVAAEMGPGANGTLTIVADLETLGPDGVEQTRAAVAEDARIVEVGPVVSSPDGAIALFEAQPAFGPTDERTADLIASLRDDVLPAFVDVTGSTAVLSDISSMLAERLWLVVAFVVGVSMLLLAVMFRSLVVPVKAAAMNLLSIAAAYGVVTLVFQHGWGSSLLGMDHAVPVSSWVPILMFAVLFGLSMDYEVFLLSRVREAWLATGDARGSVAAGLASSARVISAAAAIMVAVFLGFATESAVTVKMLGVGMAAAVALDATLVRLVLVPATMTMLGRWNWWLPSWLDRDGRNDGGSDRPLGSADDRPAVPVRI